MTNPGSATSSEQIYADIDFGTNSDKYLRQLVQEIEDENFSNQELLNRRGFLTVSAGIRQSGSLVSADEIGIEHLENLSKLAACCKVIIAREEKGSTTYYSDIKRATGSELTRSRDLLQSFAEHQIEKLQEEVKNTNFYKGKLQTNLVKRDNDGDGVVYQEISGFSTDGVVTKFNNVPKSEIEQNISDREVAILLDDLAQTEQQNKLEKIEDAILSLQENFNLEENNFEIIRDVTSGDEGDLVSLAAWCSLKIKALESLDDMGDFDQIELGNSRELYESAKSKLGELFEKGGDAIPKRDSSSSEGEISGFDNQSVSSFEGGFGDDSEDGSQSLRSDEFKGFVESISVPTKTGGWEKPEASGVNPDRFEGVNFGAAVLARGTAIRRGDTNQTFNSIGDGNSEQQPSEKIKPSKGRAWGRALLRAFGKSNKGSNAR
jgi:hypothetical protein